MRRLAVALPAVALLAGTLLSSCTPPSMLPAEGRQSVSRSLARQPRFLRVAVYVGPFFGDSSRVLLSDRPVSELEVLTTPDGKPILPPAATGILLPGTPVFVDQVQFPTGAIVWSRPLTTPRFTPWLLATVEGVPRPAVLLLSSESSRAEDVIAEVGRVLTPDDPTTIFAALPDAWRDAIREKAVVEGMTREAAAMAWGFPDKIVIDRPNRTEDWSWQGSTRKASFHDDRLVRKSTGAPKPADPPR